METLTEACDPFSAPASTTDNLLNLATGKATATATKDYLLQTLEQGKNRRKKFQEECADDENRFMKSIQRRKVENFASENSKKKRKFTTKAKQVTEGVRDTFVRLMVVVSESTNFDLKHVLEFPITDYPLSIAHGDGSIMKTVKANLLKKLESMQNGFAQNYLPRIDVTVIDGGLLLHSFLSVTSCIASYANLARNQLSHVCSNAGGEIHVLFDTYIQSSIKGYERQLRGAEDRPFVITGQEQAPKQSGQQLLKNGLFKDQLAIFLLNEWVKDHYGPIIGRKRLVVSHGGRCVTYTFNATENIMKVEHPPHLQGIHEEADTLIAFHVNHVKGHILVRASDTDVLVILLGMLGRQMGDNPNKIIMDCGSGNTRRYIDISSIATELEAKQPGLAAAQPGLRAFTGCDFTSAFYRKGKVKPFEILAEDVKGDFIEFFKRLTSVDEPDEEKAADFVCTLYGFKNLHNVDEARHAKLLQMTGKIKEVNTINYCIGW